MPPRSCLPLKRLRNTGKGHEPRLGIAGVFFAVLLITFGLSVPAVAGDSSAAAPARSSTESARSCESLASLALPNTTVTSATTVAATATVPEYCNFQLTVNNPPSNDAVRVGVFLPTSTWNGRFEGIGGGG